MDRQTALERHLDGVRRSHQGLVTMLTALQPDLDAGAPSLLPGWSIGHVLTHLARNADSIRQVVEASRRGEVAERYPGGAAARDAAIEAGHDRPAGVQVADVASSAAALEAAWAAHATWDGHSREPDGREIPVADLVFSRWREVEVHRADLGLGYGPADWPSGYVREDLRVMEMRWSARRPMGLTGLPEQARLVPDHVRLAWLLGRADLDGVAPAGPL